MNAIKFSTLILVLFFSLSCGKEQEVKVTENNTDYLIFGHFYGHCTGEACVETFKLTKNKLFEDSNDEYSATEPFNFTELPSGKFEKVKELMDSFPVELLNEKEITLGCPDCHDQGGIFIQYSKNGSIKRWRIDQDKRDTPAYLHDFMDKVNEKIALINE